MTRPQLNTWLIAFGHRIDQTYPCRCELGQRCKPWVSGGSAPCPCAGRTDTDAVPAHCCARRAAESATRREAA
jgi:hypothetical protein